MNYRCLIVDDMHQSIIPMLQKLGIQSDYRPEISRKEIKTIISNYQGLILRSKTFVDRDLLQNATSLRFVARAGSGIDNLDEEYLSARSISIFNAPEGNRDSVGEHVVGLILSSLHNINNGHAQVKNDIWDREGNRGEELGNKTVGIIGYGNMGTSLAKKLSAFGCKIIAFDKYKPVFNNSFAQSVSLAQIKEETDILSLHIPLTKETSELTSGNFFSDFKKNIIFINSSRGEIAPLDSIAEAIKKGTILKAGLDVLENEKLNTLTTNQSSSFEFLRNSGKVIFTPHVAGWSKESYQRIGEVLVKKIQTLF